MAVVLIVHAVETMNISDTLTEDISFYYRRLSDYPSVLATIKYSIIYKPHKKSNGDLRLDIYVNENQETKNIRRQCTTADS